MHAPRVLLVALVLAPLSASAGELTKEQCLDAHSQGQDAKAQNKLTLARKLFMTCAQQACPALVQGDCARFANDLTQLQPSVTFVARDGNGADLPDTTVYVDDALVVTRLDGNLHDVDPGKHTVKFQNGSKEQVLTIVIGPGEKGRALVATFGGGSVPSPANAAASSAAQSSTKPTSVTKHPGFAKPLIYSGVVLALGGAALATVGVLRVPGNCTLATHQCAAPPGDPTLATAASAIKTFDIGLAVGIAGVAAIAGGITWYIKGAHAEKDKLAVSPWMLSSGGGVALGGAF